MKRDMQSPPHFRTLEQQKLNAREEAPATSSAHRIQDRLEVADVGKKVFCGRALLADR